MKVKLLFFGITQELAGSHKQEMEVPGDLESMKKKLFREIPGLENLSLAFAVNDTIVSGNTALQEGDEIAIMPPFAGG